MNIFGDLALDFSESFLWPEVVLGRIGSKVSACKPLAKRLQALASPEAAPAEIGSRKVQ